MRSVTGITRILLFQTDYPRVSRFPVPQDKGNVGSGDEIVGGGVTCACGHARFRINFLFDKFETWQKQLL